MSIWLVNIMGVAQLVLIGTALVLLRGLAKERMMYRATLLEISKGIGSTHAAEKARKALGIK
jgi:hypothetical protein